MRKTYTWFVIGVVATGIAFCLIATRPHELYKVRYTCDVVCGANAVASISTDGNFCRQSCVGDESLSCVNPKTVDSFLHILDSVKQDDAAISNIAIKISCRALNPLGHEKAVSMLSSMHVYSEVSPNRVKLILSVCDQNAETASLFMDACFRCLKELVREHNERLVERSMSQTRTGIEKLNRRIKLLRSSDNCDVSTEALNELEKKLDQLILEEARIKSEMTSRVLDIRLVKKETLSMNSPAGAAD